MPYANSTTVVFDHSCQDTGQIVNAALRGLHQIFRSGYKYQKAGVLLADLSPKNTEQLSLLKECEPVLARIDRLMLTLDDINRIYGRNTVQFGSALLSGTWRMRQKMLCPAYTTRWEEIKVVKI